MKRLLLFVLLASTLLVPLPVEAHGTCSAQASPLQHGSGFVAFTGGATCGSTTHGFAVTLRIQRRTPGSSWSTVASKSITGAGITNISDYLQLNSFNCAKDYRGQSQGSASPGDHSFSKFSSILTHTC